MFQIKTKIHQLRARPVDSLKQEGAIELQTIRKTVIFMCKCIFKELKRKLLWISLVLTKYSFHKTSIRLVVFPKKCEMSTMKFAFNTFRVSRASEPLCRNPFSLKKYRQNLIQYSANFYFLQEPIHFMIYTVLTRYIIILSKQSNSKAPCVLH